MPIARPSSLLPDQNFDSNADDERKNDNCLFWGKLSASDLSRTDGARLMQLTEIEAKHHVNFLLELSSNEITPASDPVWSRIEKVNEEITATLKELNETVDSGSTLPLSSSDNAILHLNQLLNHDPLIIDSLTLKASKSDDDHAVIALSARIGQVPVNILCTASGLDDVSWSIFRGGRLGVFTSKGSATITLPAQRNEHDHPFRAIDAYFPAKEKLVYVKSEQALQRASFSRLMHSAIDSAPLSAQEKLHALFSLAVTLNHQSLALDVLSHPEVSLEVRQLAVANAFKFCDPDTVLNAIPLDDGQSLYELHELTYTDLHRYDNYMSPSMERSSIVIDPITTYLGGNTTEQSLFLLDKLQTCFRANDAWRAKILSTLLPAVSSERRKRPIL